MSKILCDKIRKRRKRTAKNTKNEGKKSRVDLKSRSGWIREREKEEYVKKHTRKLSDVISVNGIGNSSFPFFFFPPPPFHPIKTPPVFPGGERREERGKGRFESVAAFPLFSTSLLRFARGNVTLVSCYFSNPLRGYIKRLRKVGQSSPFSSSTLGLRTIRITDF